MKICAVTMLKNEMSILPAWASHMGTLFDYLYVVNHGSTDGTAEFLEENYPKQARVFSYNGKDYSRKLMIDELLAISAREVDADWYFFVDPDEFFPDVDHAALRKRLSEINGDSLLMNWRNCLLEAPGFPVAGMRGFRQQRVTAIGKVAVSRKIASDPDYQISVGAHSLTSCGQQVCPPYFGELYHFPIRSLEHAWKKAVRGVLVREKALQKNPDAGQIHWHYLTILNSLIESPTWAAVPGIVFDYGLPRDQACNDPRSQFEPATFRFSGVSNDVSDIIGPPVVNVPLSDALKLPEVFEDAKELFSMAPLQNINPKFKILLNKELVNVLDWHDKKFERLPDIVPPALTRFDINSAAQTMFSDLRDPVASAWGEHIPFMFSIVNLLRPRRFVELGVHNGASFLAACQELENINAQTECVAIDTWAGDPHAGRYDEKVFVQFLEKLRRYRNFSGYLRMQFDEGAEKFEDGSVDLLHIDGLHTASAVEHDFEVWKNKLSPVGAVLFHDINEFRSDFGVWRVWRKLKSQYPHIEFGHGHGLGVLAVGQNCPLKLEIEGLGSALTSPEAQEFLQIIFGNVGRNAWTLATHQKQQSPNADSKANNVDRGPILGENGPTIFLRKKLTKPFRVLKRALRGRRQSSA